MGFHSVCLKAGADYRLVPVFFILLEKNAKRHLPSLSLQTFSQTPLAGCNTAFFVKPNPKLVLFVNSPPFSIFDLQLKEHVQL